MMQTYTVDSSTVQAEIFVWNLISSFSSKELLDEIKRRTNVDSPSFSTHSYDPWTKFSTGRTPFLWSWTKVLTDEISCLYSTVHAGLRALQGGTSARTREAGFRGA